MRCETLEQSHTNVKVGPLLAFLLLSVCGKDIVLGGELRKPILTQTASTSQHSPRTPRRARWWT